MTRVPIFPPNTETNNWGDIISPVIVKAFSGLDPYTGHKIPGSRSPRFLVCGSILNLAASGDTLWGTGSLPNVKHLSRDVKVCAVRGPKTANLIRSHGVACPDVYGDPAMFMPYIYPMKSTHEYELGVISHFVEFELVEKLLRKAPKPFDVFHIDITAGVKEVMLSVSRCDAIASSSLHGIILAEGMGIPAVHVRFSDSVWGGMWKFEDYYLGTGRKTTNTVESRGYINPQTLRSAVELSVPPESNFSGLLRTCPFNHRHIEKLEELRCQ